MAAATGIAFENASMVYRRQRTSVVAVQDVDLQMTPGERLSILGPSGCGKSTLLKMLADVVHPTSGSVTIGGLTPADARQSRAFALVAQKPVMLPWRRITANVELALEVAGVPAAERRSRAVDALQLVGLSGFENSYPHELSGGMLQRAAIARALTTQPSVLLMDEPFGALDELTRERLNFELDGIVRDAGTTLVLVTHSVAEAVIMSDTVVVMSSRPGRIIHTEKIDLGPERSPSVRTRRDFVDIEVRLREMLASGHADHAEVRRVA